MEAVVKLLLGDSAQAVKSHVPIHLEAIQEVAEICKERIMEVEEKYETVIHTLMELNQASLFKQGNTEEAHMETALMKSILEDEQRQRELMQKRCDEDYGVRHLFLDHLLIYSVPEAAKETGRGGENLQ